MALKFSVSGRIARPVHEVFEAVADPKELSHYFTTGGAKGRLETGATVYWDFHDFPGAFPVEVAEVEPDRKIVLRWRASEGGEPADYQTTVTLTFEALEANRTLVTITEEGWRDTPGGLRASYGNCEGWTGMLCAMKAWLEHGFNLRDGFYK
ncbi:MAG TPA: SRPBCC family protein [Devosia sp.]|nr:SRPBCC family protein [Devosia sp.]